jgi:hypothetical protein
MEKLNNLSLTEVWSHFEVKENVVALTLSIIFIPVLYLIFFPWRIKIFFNLQKLHLATSAFYNFSGDAFQGSLRPFILIEWPYKLTFDREPNCF